MVLPARLKRNEATEIRFEPDAALRAEIAEDLGISALKKARLDGTFEPVGKADWRFDGLLGATAVQPCVVSLMPVTTRIDQRFERLFLADPPPAAPGEVEMPEDDTVEPLPGEIDLASLFGEALALALPDYPRAAGAELGETMFTEPGKTPMGDDEARPFAALKVLKGGGGGQEGG